MKLELKAIHSPNIESSLDSYKPNNNSVYLFFQLIIGVENEAGEEWFGIMVCNPKALLDEKGYNSVTIGRHLLLVFKYNYDLIVERIESYLSTCIGNNWDEVDKELSELGKSDYEDFQTPLSILSTGKVIAELKNISFEGLDENSTLKTYIPEISDDFSLKLGLSIGLKGEKKAELFVVTVCTPKYLLREYGEDAVIICRHHLIVFEYNYKRIVNEIKKYLESCTGKNWDEVAEKVSRLGYWEFEDYQED